MRNVHPCYCCRICVSGSLYLSDSHSALPARKGPRVPPTCRAARTLVLFRSPRSRCCYTRSVSVLGFAARAAWSCSSQVGRQTLARGGSRSTPALVQRAAVSSVWGKHRHPFVPVHSGSAVLALAAPWCQMWCLSLHSWQAVRQSCAAANHLIVPSIPSLKQFVIRGHC